MRRLLRCGIQGIAVTLLVRGIHQAILGHDQLAAAAGAIAASVADDHDTLFRTHAILNASLNLMVADLIDGTLFWSQNAAAYALAVLALVTSPLLCAFQEIAELTLRGIAAGAASGLLFAASWYPIRYEAMAAALRRRGVVPPDPPRGGDNGAPPAGGASSHNWGPRP